MLKVLFFIDIYEGYSKINLQLPGDEKQEQKIYAKLHVQKLLL